MFPKSKPFNHEESTKLDKSKKNMLANSWIKQKLKNSDQLRGSNQNTPITMPKVDQTVEQTEKESPF